MKKLTLVLGILTLAFGAAVWGVETTLIDEDFENPPLGNGTANPGFAGWTYNNGGSVKSRIEGPPGGSADVPGDTDVTFPNQVIQLEWTNAEANYNMTHLWSVDDLFSLSFNASPQAWGLDNPRWVRPKLYQTTGNVLLWDPGEVAATAMPHPPGYAWNGPGLYGDSDWQSNPESLYTFEFSAGSFTTGTPGQPIYLKLDHSGQRGMYYDNVFLTVNDEPPPDTDPPTPDPSEWNMEPVDFDYTSTYMKVTGASDASGVEYMFQNQTTGATSGWQDGIAWQENELDSETTYNYRVKARDKSPNQNETDWSALGSISTPTAPEGLIFSSGFQYPDYPDGTSNPSYYGWDLPGSNVFFTQQAAGDGVPGDATIPNRVLQFAWTGTAATRDTSHGWAADEIYTLSLNAAPQQWGGTNPRSFEVSLLEGDGTELWSSGDVAVPLYDPSFAGANPWPDALTFAYEIDGSLFAGIPGASEGAPLSVRISTFGQRGLFFDNVMLTYIPEPTSLALLGLGMLGLVRRRR